MDFRNTKIRIKSPEHSKAFQEAIFAAGGEWLHTKVPLAIMLYEKHIYVDSDLHMAHCHSCEGAFKKHPYKEITFPEPTKGHPHADLMTAYAEDAKTHQKPWELWQIKTGTLDWVDCRFSPEWDSSCEFRRKPKTHIVHGDFVYLSVVRDGDLFFVIDQYGRKVKGVTSISVDCEMNEPTRFTITAFDYNKDNEPHLNQG